MRVCLFGRGKILLILSFIDIVLGSVAEDRSLIVNSFVTACDKLIGGIVIG